MFVRKNKTKKTDIDHMSKNILLLVAEFLPTRDVLHLALTSREFWFKLQRVLDKRFSLMMGLVQQHSAEPLKQLLQAVVNGNHILAAHLLNNHPLLVVMKPADNLVIECKHTWQKFFAEDALMMAVKMKKIAMIKLLLSYYDKLSQTEEILVMKKNALAAWSYYDTNGNNEILIPEYHANVMQQIFDAFGTRQTEAIVSFLLNIIVPQEPVKLIEHVDVELLLLTFCKALCRDLKTLPNNDARADALCIRIMGLIETALTPETAAMFCEGLESVVKCMRDQQEVKLDPRAMMYCALSTKLERMPFYRESRDSRAGNGFDFVCGINGYLVKGNRIGLGTVQQRVEVIEQFCLLKEAAFNSIKLMARESHVKRDVLFINLTRHAEAKHQQQIQEMLREDSHAKCTIL